MAGNELKSQMYFFFPARLLMNDVNRASGLSKREKKDLNAQNERTRGFVCLCVCVCCERSIYV